MNKELTLKEIQYEEKEMLRQVIAFFKKEKFEYYIYAGTMIGAVRHKGFIPWDDDIDLVMTRPVYNKFIDYLKKHDFKISESLDVIGFELGNSDFPILKIINKNIKVDEEDKCDEYLWIDIFPLDATPENNDKFYKRVQFLNKIFVLKRQQKKHIKLMATSPFKRFIKTIFMGILRIWKYDDFIRFYLKYSTKYNYDDYDFIHNNVWTDRKPVYSKKILEPAKYQFEDLEVVGFKDYNSYLSMVYGSDYMKLPPKEKRVTHSFKAWKIK